MTEAFQAATMNTQSFCCREGRAQPSKGGDAADAAGMGSVVPPQRLSRLSSLAQVSHQLGSHRFPLVQSENVSFP